MDHSVARNLYAQRDLKLMYVDLKLTYLENLCANMNKFRIICRGLVCVI